MKFYFTEGFSQGARLPKTLGPLGVAKKERARLALMRSLEKIESHLLRKRLLRATHLRQAAFVREGYPPPRLGRFLARFDEKKLTRFDEIAGLEDVDQEGWIGLYADFDLVSVVVYSEHPQPALYLIEVGSAGFMAQTLSQLTKSPKTLKKLLQRLRGLSQ